MQNGQSQNKGSFKLPDYGELTDKDFRRLSEFIYDHFGIKLPKQKKVLLKSRLIKRLKELKLPKYSAYVDFVLQNTEQSKEEVVKMMDVVSTNKTDFFREGAHFDYLSFHVIPEFNQNGNRKIKVWSAGCSTGEEVYTLAMVLEEERQKDHLSDYLIYGSDISVSALKTAVKAVYPMPRAETIPSWLKKKYLLKSKNSKDPKVKIVKELRDKVKFMRINLVDDFYPIANDFDIIFCRNTLIYFDKETQERVINNLLNHLKIGGYLFIGHSESLLNHSIENIKQVKPTVYQKIF